jgi:hypothetical protein
MYFCQQFTSCLYRTEIVFAQSCCLFVPSRFFFFIKLLLSPHFYISLHLNVPVFWIITRYAVVYTSDPRRLPLPVPYNPRPLVSLGLSRRCRQHAPLKCLYLYTIPYGAISKTRTFLITAARTTHLAHYLHLLVIKVLHWPTNTNVQI